VNYRRKEEEEVEKVKKSPFFSGRKVKFKHNRAREELFIYCI